VLNELERVDGVMLGRAAYQSPWLLVDLERALFGPEGAPIGLGEVVAAMSEYLDSAVAPGVSVRSVGPPDAGPAARPARRARVATAVIGPCVPAAARTGVVAGLLRRTSLEESDPGTAGRNAMRAVAI